MSSTQDKTYANSLKITIMAIEDLNDLRELF